VTCALLQSADSGSIGLGSVEEIFRTVGAALGRRLKRVPDEKSVADDSGSHGNTLCSVPVLT
jgi:hypothetical protein